MKKLISSTMVLLLAAVFSVSARAADGDLFVQVDFFDGANGGCSILQVTPEAVLSELISNAQILGLTGLTSSDCQDTGLACDSSGNVFFNEDVSDNIFRATPGGGLTIFATAAQIALATGGFNDIDNGMAFGPDGNLYVAEEDSESILRIPVPLNSAIVQLIDEQDIIDALGPGAGPGDVDLEGGIAVDPFGNIYFTNDDSGGDFFTSILKLTPAGVLTVLVDQAALNAATGSTSPDLDVGVVLDGFLYVLDDGTCDCVLIVNINNGAVTVYITEDQITDATGQGNADLEGGLAIDEFGNLFIGDSADGQENIVEATQARQTSLFVSNASLVAFYEALDPTINDIALNGSMAVCGVTPGSLVVPTMSEWGMIATVLGLGIIGFIAVRRRMVKA